MNVVSLEDRFFFDCPKEKETVVLILFEIQHPLYHWLAGDLDRG